MVGPVYISYYTYIYFQFFYETKRRVLALEKRKCARKRLSICVCVRAHDCMRVHAIANACVFF